MPLYPLSAALRKHDRAVILARRSKPMRVVNLPGLDKPLVWIEPMPAVTRTLATLRYWWSFRLFVRSAIINDFKARYARSRLGLVWILVQPLAMVLIYSLILSHIIAAKLPQTDSIYAYPIYLMSGMLAWTLFAEGLGRGLGIFVEQGELIKKVAFPKALLPAIATGTVTINGMALLTMMLAVFMCLQHWPSWHYLWLALLIPLTLLFSVSLGLIFGLLNVFFRDVSQTIPVILNFLFWLTPIVYVTDMLPEAYRGYFAYNPMVSVVNAFQDVILYHQHPAPSAIVLLCCGSLIFMSIGGFLYSRTRNELADQL